MTLAVYWRLPCKYCDVSWTVCKSLTAQRTDKSREQFLQSKRQGTCSPQSVVALLKRTNEQNMEYLILVAVVGMMALYALIIVGCLKQPEW